MSFVDGKTIRILSSAQDHKRAKDGDQGLNTGGMGTFSPSPFYTKEVDEFCHKYIYQATVDAMAAEGRPFVGVIFFGLMLTEDGPKVLEYNARFGDPEAQVVTRIRDRCCQPSRFLIRQKNRKKSRGCFGRRRLTAAQYGHRLRRGILYWNKRKEEQV